MGLSQNNQQLKCAVRCAHKQVCAKDNGIFGFLFKIFSVFGILSVTECCSFCWHVKCFFCKFFF